MEYESRFSQINRSDFLEHQNATIILFDPPFSWIESLEVDKASFEYRYPPNGRRVIYYKLLIVELFSNTKENQGVVRRVTKFFDPNIFALKNVSSILMLVVRTF